MSEGMYCKNEAQRVFEIYSLGYCSTHCSRGTKDSSNVSSNVIHPPQALLSALSFSTCAIVKVRCP